MSLEEQFAEEGSEELKRIMILTIIWSLLVISAGVALVLFRDSFPALF